MMRIEAEQLLAWYDGAARELPWRVGPAARAAGEMPDPYRVWLSEIMLQQTTVATVRSYFLKFTERWPDVFALAAADDGEVMAAWAGLGYYARARNLLKCARAVAALGAFPDTEEGLRALPGIGPYTAAAIGAIAFDRHATVVDGNVERVIARHALIETPLPAAKPEIRAAAEVLTPRERPGDYAQAVMDLGATICTPTRPSCLLCPITSTCAGYRAGIQETLPRKAPKPEKPTRHGHAYVARRADGAILLERRPERGLLGGMLGFPCSDWIEGEPEPRPPLIAEWRSLGAVTHVFTHFRLSMTVHHALVPAEALPDRGEFMPGADFDPSALPTAMRKVWRAVASKAEAA